MENPIPFIPSRLARALTTLYLHALYARQLILPTQVSACMPGKCRAPATLSQVHCAGLVQGAHADDAKRSTPRRARAAMLLVHPTQMSADWSFSCVAIVKSVRDPRNALSILLYAFLLGVARAAKPLTLVSNWWRALAGGRGRPIPAPSAGALPAKDHGADAKIQLSVAPGPTPDSALHAARWRLFVTAGLVVAPLLPATNLFFYVGTFLAERLLLVPSGKAVKQAGAEPATRLHAARHNAPIALAH